jgi:hypothetical protein
VPACVETLAAARALEDAKERSRALGRLAVALRRPELLEEAVAAARRRPEDQTLAEVAAGLAWAGQTALAREVARSIPSGAQRGREEDGAPRPEVVEVAPALAREGRVEEALALARSLPAAEWPMRGEALTGIATVLAARGRVAEALRIIGSPLAPDWVFRVFAASCGHLDPELAARIWQRLQDVSRWA